MIATPRHARAFELTEGLVAIPSHIRAFELTEGVIATPSHARAFELTEGVIATPSHVRAFEVHERLLEHPPEASLLVLRHMDRVMRQRLGHNRRSSHGHHGSKRRELAHHAHSRGSHAFSHTLYINTSNQKQRKRTK